MTRLLLVVVLVTSACVRRVETTPQVPPPTPVDRTLYFEPVEIRSSPEQVAISELNDAELWAIGNAAWAAGDWQKAALHFERLGDFHENSEHRPDALHRAGLALEKMRDHAGALSRFLEASKLRADPSARLESMFKAADAWYFLGDYASAATMLETIASVEGLPAVKQAEVQVKRAVCLLADGQHQQAERELRRTIDFIREHLRDEVRDGYLPSQAQFHLAEVFRHYFQAAKLDPATSTREELMADLEYKAQMLLSAQGHYLRCIRVGHPEWATASGYRIGELYQKLYEQMTGASVPADLDADQTAIYLEELRDRVRVLITKAIDAYEKTLATAERVGATNPFVNQTRADLERMKALLVEVPAKEEAAQVTPDQS